MEKILAGVQKFRHYEYPSNRELFESLANRQQKPIALFITCADSRVNPNLITQTDPGDLFLIRNAGNIVPTYGSNMGGEAATIEYSIEVLGIRNIIICGHSQCGAMAAMLAGTPLENLPASKSFFAHAESTRRIVQSKHRELSPAEKAIAATQENVLVQLNNLSTHPSVAVQAAAGELHLFGWYYDIGSGRISQYDQASGHFLELNGQASPTALLPIRTAAAVEAV